MPRHRFLILTTITIATVLAIVISSISASTQLDDFKLTNPTDVDLSENTIDNHRFVECGSIVVNLTSIIINNPNYPEPTYTKSICETVIERANPSIKQLNIKFRQLELYRPTYDGVCIHDRFGVYTDLNNLINDHICGNHDGRTIIIPFPKNQHNLILSIMTSDIDHDRFWSIQVNQE